MEEKKFLYADVNEQTKRANSFLTIGYVIFYLTVLGVVLSACIRGIRSVGYTGMLTAIIVLSIVVKKNSATRCILP